MSDDLVKRSDVINLLWYFQDEYCSAVVGDFEKLPSADRPQGEWKSVKASIYPYGYDVKCSVCSFRMGSSFGYRYCPSCGARMKGADDE